jgi:cytochrome c biogenesis protein CcmG, thiol:disulfide interchange protein DsbE
MSKRQIAALAALVLVPVALVAVVLLTVLGGDDEKNRPISETRTSTGAGSRQSDGAASTAPKPRGGVSGARDDSIDRKLDQRQPAPVPEVALPVLDEGNPPAPAKEKIPPAGENVNLDELRGTPVVLSLWSSWCTPCGPTTRVMQTESERTARRGVLFLGLDVQDNERAARRFREQLALDYPTARDDSGDAARQLGATGVPETFFISSAGEIVGHVIGAASLAQVELGALAAQSGKPFGLRQGGVLLPLR